jgi:putative resolvase
MIVIIINSMSYVSPKEAKEHLGVSIDTLRRWAKEGKIEFITTNGKHRRYKIDTTKETGQKIIYARVSSKKQQLDLQRQIDFLKSKYPTHSVISDIASGINFNRKGFTSILDQLFNRNIKEVVVYSNDRLSRFANDLISHIFTHFGAKLIIENDSNDKTPQEELAEDLLSIVSVFSARYHGSRKYKINKQENKKN